MTATKKISLTINGKVCAGKPGQTILEIARANNIYIPTLCYLKGLTPWGGCRLCIVEIRRQPEGGAVLRHTGGGRLEDHHRQPAPARPAQGHAGTAVQRTQPLLPDVPV